MSTHASNEAIAVGLEVNCKSAIVGILPLVHIKHWLFGNSLVSMPFCDGGGVLATDADTERKLIEHSLRIADGLGVPVVDLRQYQPLEWWDDAWSRKVEVAPGWAGLMWTDSKKVRMLLDLPVSPELLMQSFKSKLRSQIGKSIREGLTVSIGGLELLADFYDIFATNMRDLGSPVHSKQFILQILLNFPDRAKVFVVYRREVPIACSLTLGFNRILSNPWSSSLRRYRQFAPNMFLYWSMLDFACRQGYQKFDFGRSTVDEGTYRFKEQWGAIPAPLYWYRLVRDTQSTKGMGVKNSSMKWAMACWKYLPTTITRALGPKIRRYISL